MDTIGKRIAAYRKKKNIKQDELAEMLGVSPQAVSKWENDASCPDISLLPALSGLLCVSIDEIITGKRYYPGTCNIEELDSKTFTLLFECDGVECSKMNIPMSRVRKAVEKGLAPITLADCKAAFNYVDFAAVINLVVGIAETGQTGILFECSDGKAKVKFIVE
ncbi:MAG: helix-turn-helix transcriptional regulator [Clostridia bacterium]|nr:helix-turn-helix transcriptional regulator [Clostridia bacterium]